jgi:hypothetical protein
MDDAPTSPDSAEIVVTPLSSAWTSPTAETLARAVSELAHAIGASLRGRPAASMALATRSAESPTASESLSGTMTTAAAATTPGGGSLGGCSGPTWAVESSHPISDAATVSQTMIDRLPWQHIRDSFSESVRRLDWHGAHPRAR